MSGDNINELELAMYAPPVPCKRQIKVAMLIVRAFRTDYTPAEDSIDSALERLEEHKDSETFGMTNDGSTADGRVRNTPVQLQRPSA